MCWTQAPSSSSTVVAPFVLSLAALVTWRALIESTCLWLYETWASFVKDFARGWGLGVKLLTEEVEDARLIHPVSAGTSTKVKGLLRDVSSPLAHPRHVCEMIFDPLKDLCGRTLFRPGWTPLMFKDTCTISYKTLTDCHFQRHMYQFTQESYSQFCYNLHHPDD